MAVAPVSIRCISPTKTAGDGLGGDGDGLTRAVGVIHQGSEITATITNVGGGLGPGDRQYGTSRENKFRNPVHIILLSSRTNREI